MRCGDVVCGTATPCCGLCGYAACAGVGDAGVPECPAFTTTYVCDGEEECGGSDVCCFTLGGTECRPEVDCDLDVGGALSDFLGDGGIQLPDAGPPVDGGYFDGGTALEYLDGGTVDGGMVDGGSVTVYLDGGPGPQPDAGSFVDALQETLDQGVPVCRSSFFDCDLLQGELCCTSDRLTAVDLGFCLPALVCLGDVLP
ncbi:MAG: hypothetical protein A2138_09280 [Deltaproteobacteria bacterium RBG_16_71_12]|nr:MAG: hypothetical protein A2138_09280 [Deltaproteobacteria bacterium RBG_16_71_12]